GAEQFGDATAALDGASASPDTRRDPAETARALDGPAPDAAPRPLDGATAPDRLSSPESITFDTSFGAVTPTGPDSSLSWSHSTGAGTHTLLVVSCALRGASNVSGITYGGTKLELIAAQANGSNARVEQWKLLAPAPGNHPIVVSVSG